MNREDKLREELEDAWFALVMEKIAQQEGAEYNALNEQLKKDPKYAVPEEVTRRNLETIRKLAEQEKKQKAARTAIRVFKRVACVAAVMSMLLVSVYAVLPPSRKTAVLNLLIETTDVSTRLVMEDEDRIEDKEPEATKDEPKVLLGYQLPELPEEFVVQEEKQMNNMARIKYATSSGEIVEFRIVRDTSGAVDIDTENAEATPITIHGYSGLLNKKNGVIKIVWNDTLTDTFILIEGEGIEESYIQELAENIEFLAE